MSLSKKLPISSSFSSPVTARRYEAVCMPSEMFDSAAFTLGDTDTKFRDPHMSSFSRQAQSGQETCANRTRYLSRTPVCPYLSNGLSVHWGATEKVACFADSEWVQRCLDHFADSVERLGLVFAVPQLPHGQRQEQVLMAQSLDCSPVSQQT